jgi:hypothetical protein
MRPDGQPSRRAQTAIRAIAAQGLPYAIAPHHPPPPRRGGRHGEAACLRAGGIAITSRGQGTLDRTSPWRTHPRRANSRQGGAPRSTAGARRAAGGGPQVQSAPAQEPGAGARGGCRRSRASGRVGRRSVHVIGCVTSRRRIRAAPRSIRVAGEQESNNARRLHPPARSASPSRSAP